MSAPDPEALARLDRLQADPNLRHTGARWRAHAAVYPDRGAEELGDGYKQRDAEQAVRVERALDELREKSPESTDDIGYLEWVLAELRGGS